MKTLNFKYLLIGLALFVAAAGGAALKPTKYIADQGPKIDLETMIPKQFGEWTLDTSIVPILPSPDQQQSISETYSQLVNRTYVNGDGKMMMVSIAYGSNQNQKLKAHRQEVCYVAQGFQIRSIKHITARVASSDITVTQMFAVREQREEPVTYWFTVGNQVVQSHLQRLVAELQYGLSGTIPDGVLVRISSLNSNAQSAFQDHLTFINEMLETMPPGSRARFVGD
jgi:EpsI family protein